MTDDIERLPGVDDDVFTRREQLLGQQIAEPTR